MYGVANPIYDMTYDLVSVIARVGGARVGGARVGGARPGRSGVESGRLESPRRHWGCGLPVSEGVASFSHNVLRLLPGREGECVCEFSCMLYL